MVKNEVIVVAQKLALIENSNKLNKIKYEMEKINNELTSHLDELDLKISELENKFGEIEINEDDLTELITKDEKENIKKQIEKKYINLKENEKEVYEEFEKIYEQAKKYLEKNGINEDDNLFFNIMSSEEISNNFKEYKSKYKFLKWNSSDYFICIIGSIIGLVVDNLIVVDKSGESWFQNLNFIKELEKKCKVSYDPSNMFHLKNEIHIMELLEKTLSIKGLNPGNHRILSYGHDLFRIVTATKDILNGTFTVVGTDGKINIIKRCNENYLDEVNVLKALLIVLGHFISDIGTSAGVPIPGSTFFLRNVSSTEWGVGDKKNLKVNEIVIEMYKKGYDFRHLIKSSLVPASIEIIIKLSYFLLNHEEILTEDKKNQHDVKIAQIITLSHSLVSTQNILKTYTSKNFLKLNIAEIIAFIKSLKKMIDSDKKLSQKFNKDFQDSLGKIICN